MSARRPYVSPKREARSLDTSRRILAAARTLFARHGFASTTIEAVAREAKVSAQSIYQRFGSKAGLIRAQLDDIEQAGDIEALRSAIGDPRLAPETQAEALAHFIRRLSEVAGDLLIAASSSNDPQLRALVDNGMARHRAGVMMLAEQWAHRQLLRPGLTARRARDIIAAICSIPMFIELRDTYGWSLEETEAWTAQAIGRLVLTPATATIDPAENP